MSTNVLSAIENSSDRLSSENKFVTVTEDHSLTTKIMKTYQADQQVKYLNLQAEIEMLFQKLKTIEQQKNSHNLEQIENSKERTKDLVGV